MVTQNAWNSEDPAQVLRGGTGLTTLTDHNLLIGNDQQPIVLLPPDPTEGIPVVSNGTTSDPSYGTAFVVGGGTGATSFTPFSTITAGGTATSPLNPVSPGVSGDVLTSNGPDAFPSYQPGGGPPGTGGSFIWLASQTANNDPQITFDNTFINSTFINYMILYDAIVPNSNSYLILDISEDNGSTWISSGFLVQIQTLTTLVSNSPETSSFLVTGSSNNNNRINSDPDVGFIGQSNLYNFTSGGTPKMLTWGVYRRQLTTTAPARVTNSGGGTAPDNITVNAIRFIMSASNISTGTFHLYGVRTS